MVNIAEGGSPQGIPSGERIDSSVPALLSSETFLSEYQKCNPEDKCGFLMDAFDKLWQKTDLRPESAASAIRRLLGNSAPRNKCGPPEIPIPLGFCCHYKAQLAVVGIHSAPMMGICSDDGVASAIVVNGGYEDDVDRGTVFIYVGEGGETTGESQQLNRGNQALLRALQRGSSVRVVRGFKAHSRFAPCWGFRYDGLYKIECGYWDTGAQDRRVWKFVFRSLEREYLPVLCSCFKSSIASPKATSVGSNSQTDNTSPVLQTSNTPTAFLERVNYKLAQHRKMLSVTDKQIKDHCKTQALNLTGPTRRIRVMGLKRNFVVAVAQLLESRKSLSVASIISEFGNPSAADAAVTSKSDSQATNSDSTSNATAAELSADSIRCGDTVDVENHTNAGLKAKANVQQNIDTPQAEKIGTIKPSYRLPSFRVLLEALRRGSDKQWKTEVLAPYEAGETTWARAGFLPFVLRLICRQTSDTKESLKNGSFRMADLAINSALLYHHCLPYFPQSLRDGVTSLIVLKPPFEKTFDVVKDMSQSQESFPIPVFNDVDEMPPPADFTYITESVAFSSPPISVPVLCQGCVPQGLNVTDCTIVRGKYGAVGYKCPATGHVYCGGIRKSAQDRVKGDCGPNCPCSDTTCTNSVLFHCFCRNLWKRGVQFRVSVRRIPRVGWGVFAEEAIPHSNTFVLEYAGEVINVGEMRARVNKYEKLGLSNFCFEVFQTEDHDSEAWKYPCVDSFFFGNVARLLNHSCDPNLQSVTHYHYREGSEHQALGLSFFSRRPIAAGEQLTYDYGLSYTKMKCHCGSPKCRGDIRRRTSPQKLTGVILESPVDASKTPIDTAEDLIDSSLFKTDADDVVQPSSEPVRKRRRMSAEESIPK